MFLKANTNWKDNQAVTGREGLETTGNRQIKVIMGRKTAGRLSNDLSS